MPNFNSTASKPKELDILIDYSKKLSEKFKYVRVDLYIENNKVYFGELTFTPAGGLSSFSDKKYDIELGKYLNISENLII